MLLLSYTGQMNHIISMPSYQVDIRRIRKPKQENENLDIWPWLLLYIFNDFSTKSFFNEPKNVDEKTRKNKNQTTGYHHTPNDDDDSQ